MYFIVFYVPKSHLEIVKNALFDAGAGQIGLYERCSWQTLGTGQFRAKSGSTPYIGKQDIVENIEEYKVEMVFNDELLFDVIKALRSFHPYEEPAFHVFKCEDIS